MRSIAVTRPDPQGASTARRLAAMGFAVQRLPLLRCVALPMGDLPAGTAALAVTSRTAAMLLAARNDLKSLPVYAVGAGTALEAERAGFQRVFAAGGDVDALAAAIIAAAPRGTICHIGGAEQRGDLTGALRAAGLRAERRILYEMVPADALPAGPTDAVALYSPRTATIFKELAQGTAWRGTVCVALSGAVAEALGGRFAVHVAGAPTEDALVAALSALPD